MNKILKITSSILVYGLILISTIIISLVIFYSVDIPDYEKLQNYYPPTITRLYSEDGQLIEEYSNEYRIFIPFDEIPKNVINAFLAAEDNSFYENPGIDHRGILRAFWQNIFKAGENKNLVGGSTITQQVVKNFLLSDEKTIKRKVQEAILSFRISNSISKDRILELYLNQIFLGNKSYGIVAAAYNYFGKSIDQLDLAEMALLAALPKAPSRFNPIQNPERALERRNWVLLQMYQDGFINKPQLQQALNKPLELNRLKKSRNDVGYYTEEVRQIVADQFGSQELYDGGLNIFTSCNLKMQNIAQGVLQKHLLDYDRLHGYRGPIAHIDFNDEWPRQLAEIINNIVSPISAWKIAVVLQIDKHKITVSAIDGKQKNIAQDSMVWGNKKIYDILQVGDVVFVEQDTNNDKNYILRQIPEVNGGAVIINPHNGKVLAMAGGFSNVVSKFNRVTQAIRQPGSAFKSFVYLTAFEKNIAPNDIVYDSPISLPQGRNQPNWTPKNYNNDFLGAITLRVALEKSRNIPTIRLAQRVGLKNISAMAEKLDIYESPIRDMSAVLGANDTTLLRLSSAYATIANGGYKVFPTFIDKIQDRNGKVIYRSEEDECTECGDRDILPEAFDNREKIVSEQSAFQLNSILHGATKRGTSKRLANMEITIAGKTGTTNDNKDAWFIGYTPDLVIGVYIGYDQPRSLGKNATGATLALPVFKDIISQLTSNKDKPFKIPSDIKLINIDLKTGKIPNADTVTRIQEAFKESQTTAGAEEKNDSDGIEDEEVKQLLADLQLDEEDKE